MRSKISHCVMQNLSFLNSTLSGLATWFQLNKVESRVTCKLCGSDTERSSYLATSAESSEHLLPSSWDAFLSGDQWPLQSSCQSLGLQRDTAHTKQFQGQLMMCHLAKAIRTVSIGNSFLSRLKKQLLSHLPGGLPEQHRQSVNTKLSIIHGS